MTSSKAVSSFSIKGCFTISIFTQLTHSLVLLSQRHSYYTFWFHLSDTKSLSNTPRTDWLDQALCPGVWWWWWCLLTVMTTEHCRPLQTSAAGAMEMWETAASLQYWLHWLRLRQGWTDKNIKTCFMTQMANELTILWDNLQF